MSTKICQSCGSPLEGQGLSHGAKLGTEANGVPSKFYCSNCYHNGAFIQADISLETMQEMGEGMLKGTNIPAEGWIEYCVKGVIPSLKRWNSEL